MPHRQGEVPHRGNARQPTCILHATLLHQQQRNDHTSDPVHGGVTKQKQQTELPGPVHQTRPTPQAVVVRVHLLLHWFSLVCTQFRGRALTAAQPNVYVVASALGHPEFPPAVRGRCEQYTLHHENSNATMGTQVDHQELTVGCTIITFSPM